MAKKIAIKPRQNSMTRIFSPILSQSGKPYCKVSLISRGEGGHGIPFITLETFFDLVLQAQSTKAKQFRREALRVVLGTLNERFFFIS